MSIGEHFVDGWVDTQSRYGCCGDDKISWLCQESNSNTLIVQPAAYSPHRLSDIEMLIGRLASKRHGFFEPVKFYGPVICSLCREIANGKTGYNMNCHNNSLHCDTRSPASEYGKHLHLAITDKFWEDHRSLDYNRQTLPASWKVQSQ